MPPDLLSKPRTTSPPPSASPSSSPSAARRPAGRRVPEGQRSQSRRGSGPGHQRRGHHRRTAEAGRTAHQTRLAAGRRLPGPERPLPPRQAGERRGPGRVRRPLGRTDARLRALAVQMLGDWPKPPRRDYITGLTQDLSEPVRRRMRSTPSAGVLAKLFAGPEAAAQGDVDHRRGEARHQGSRPVPRRRWSGTRKRSRRHVSTR